MRNKKIIQKGMKALLFSLLLVMLCGMTSMADEYVNMKKGKNGVYTSSGEFTDYGDVYNKIVIKKPCVATVTGCTIYTYINTYGSLGITLMDSKFKTLEENTTYVNSQEKRCAFYGLKAGTYYIKAGSTRNFVLSVSIQNISDKSGSSKKKAASLAKGKNVKGLMCAGEKASKADWYKLNVTKSKVLQLTIDAAANGYFEFYIYGPSYPEGIRIGSHKDTKTVYYSINQLTRKKMKIKTGTYYIKAVRGSYYGKSSGVYQIKWNLK